MIILQKIKILKLILTKQMKTNQFLDIFQGLTCKVGLNILTGIVFGNASVYLNRYWLNITFDIPPDKLASWTGAANRR